MPTGELTSELDYILTHYARARSSASFTGNELRPRFAAAEAILKQRIDEAQFQHFEVRFGIGQGNWAAIPWIAVLDERETKSIQEGIYCVLLFAEDMSGV